MRVTDSIITRNLMDAINQKRENMGQIQQQMSTGKRILKPSNDPQGYMKSRRLNETIGQNKQYIDTITSTRAWMENSLQVLSTFEDQIMAVREIGIQSADVANQNVRNELANRLDGIIEDTVALANGKYMDKYIFSGSLTRGNDPFTYDGTSVSYQGNTDKITRRIAENQNMEINVSGQTLTNTGLFQNMIDLRDALRADDDTAIHDALGAVEGAEKQLSNIISAQGSLIRQLDLTQQRLETANANLLSNLSETEDADLMDAIVRYNREELAYKAALQTTSESLRLNLLDYL
ncbi:MAG: flagellar hook-associated protein 3 [Candidatus Marinimicrobia bacterium]|nr:flagellar hook-associated protein 3 [Candidatus Neomarinimicrobiota bacterium]MCF7841126.1 flagellar hook-associated protein 3 [Candidatus Neomarinimicrobiota bacterium]